MNRRKALKCLGATLIATFAGKQIVNADVALERRSQRFQEGKPYYDENSISLPEVMYWDMGQMRKVVLILDNEQVEISMRELFEALK
jgi:hypothetical protein